MGSDEWYRVPTWSEAASREFEHRLGRARGQASEYLRIQGDILSEAPDSNDRLVGRSLLRRLLETYPESFSTAHVWERLATSYALDHDFDTAVAAFESCFAVCRSRKTKSGTSGIPEMGLAEVLMRRRCPGDDHRAARLLASVESEVHQTLIPRAARYWYLCAALAARRDSPAAAIFADRALQILDHGPELVRPIVRADFAARGEFVSLGLRGERALRDLAERDAVSVDAAPASVAEVFDVSGEPVIHTFHIEHAAQVALWHERTNVELTELRDELRSHGITVDTVWDLRKRPDELRSAIPTLIEHLHHQYPDEVRVVIVDVLRETRVSPDQWTVLSDLYRTTDPQTDSATMSGLAELLSAEAGKAHLGVVLELLHDSTRGSSRSSLLPALTRMRAPHRWVNIERLSHDPQLAAQAREMLTARQRRERQGPRGLRSP